MTIINIIWLCEKVVKVHISITHLIHDFALTFLHVFAIGFHNGLEEAQVLHVTAVGLNAVHEVMHHTVADLIAQVVVVPEDVAHGFCLKKLRETKRESNEIPSESSYTIIHY